MSGNKKELEELKAEMKNHLLEAVYELQSGGKTEQEAIQIAIERFGGENEIRSIVGQLFKAQKIFAKRVLYIALAFLLLSLSVFGFLYQKTESEMNELSIIATQINNILENKEVISPEMKQKIETLVKGTNHISSVKVFNVNNIKQGEDYENIFNYVENAKPDYLYQRIVWGPKWLGTDFYPYGNGDDHWYTEMEHRSFGMLETVVLFVGMAVYWTLFSIWAIINAYHQKRLNAGWTLMFIVFNVLGYFIYRLLEKRQFRHL
ncbi:permease prefix domain 1-containing protein [Neobacillus niacini]|uniref:permease prefix domain 1-containing protein n=1 Tax=Neobacillus niacini TaxID=86668 RepID=UPI0028557F9D|nr:permease prefix domain 1-containing protein [Neobacillus niacini]MDR7002035.1 cytochrome c-type biogenesis protein CcmH/NrfF [Neobacillus niacini]